MTRKQAVRPFLCGASDVFSPSGRVTLVDPRDRLVRLCSLTSSVVDAFRLVSPEPTETLSVADWHGLTALEDRLGQLRMCLAQDWLLDEPGKNISWANLTSEQNAALLRLDDCTRKLAAWLATAMERGNHGGRPTELASSIGELLPLFDAASAAPVSAESLLAKCKRWRESLRDHSARTVTIPFGSGDGNRRGPGFVYLNTLAADLMDLGAVSLGNELYQRLANADPKTIDPSADEAIAWIAKAEMALRSESLPAGVARETPESNGAIGLEERALALLVAHPDWTDTQIAREVPCSRTTLYKWKKFVAAREAMKTARLDVPRGSKDKDGTLEAW